jgi:hypothetical protein
MEGMKYSGANRNCHNSRKDHARKPINNGNGREDVAAILNVNRTTLYRALAI